MRKVLLMFFAVAMLVGFGASGAMAASSKAPGCDNSGPGNNNDKPGCRDDDNCSNRGKGNSNDKPGCDKPRKCRDGYERRDRDHKCVPKPKKCDDGFSKDEHGKCQPNPMNCPAGKEKVNGMCVPKCKDDEMRNQYGDCVKKPVPVPNPVEGPCAKADLVLLEDLFKGTGALLCLYVGENAPNATAEKDCAGSLIALPVDNLVGACLFLPPADVDRSTGASPSPLSGVTAVAPGAPATGGTGLDALTSTLTSALSGLL